MADPAADDLEEQHLLTLERPEVERALRTGEFKVIGWATAMALALLALDQADGEATETSDTGAA